MRLHVKDETACPAVCRHIRDTNTISDTFKEIDHGVKIVCYNHQLLKNQREKNFDFSDYECPDQA